MSRPRLSMTCRRHSLVRLRLLTEDAARRVDDISEAGRHQALIALDGACKHALWLAVRQGGLRLKEGQRAGVPALQRAVAEQRRAWKLLGWSGVNLDARGAQRGPARGCGSGPRAAPRLA